jgi:hypothetical protein
VVTRNSIYYWERKCVRKGGTGMRGKQTGGHKSDKEMEKNRGGQK